MVNFTKRQWLSLIVIGVANFFNAICVSLQAPFYPQEAEKKQCSATEYGLVFGIFEFVIFVVSPVYGQYLNKIGTKLTFNAGIYVTGIGSVLFGLLDKVEGHYPFIILSFIIRIVQAMGTAAFVTASFAIIAKEFPDNVATTFALLEMCFGLGLIFGPMVGGALYQVGGYSLPFVVVGLSIFFLAFLTAIILPKHERNEDKKSGPSIFKILKIPGVLLTALSIVATSMSIGFLQTILEPHLRQFQLAPVLLGLVFVINGGTYAVVSPVFGWICDHLCPPKVIIVLGTVLVAAAFCLIGPAPFLPVSTILWLCMVGLVLHGLGIAAQLVASFGDALSTSLEHGFPNNIETFGLISGLWASSFALGAFIGLSISGILYDYIGFRKSSMLIVVLHLQLGIIITFFMFASKRNPTVEIIDENSPIAGCSRYQNMNVGNDIVKSIQSVEKISPHTISTEKSKSCGISNSTDRNSLISQSWPERESPQRLSSGSHSYGAVGGRNISTSYSHRIP